MQNSLAPLLAYNREGEGAPAWALDDTTMTTDDYPQKITFGEMRASGVRDVLVYCRDHRCSHHIAISADFWPDHLRLSDIEDRFVCQVCGKRGADIRPDFPLGRMGAG